MTESQIDFVIYHEDELAEIVGATYGWWVGRGGINAVGLGRSERDDIPIGEHPYHIAVYRSDPIKGVTDNLLPKLLTRYDVRISSGELLSLPVVYHDLNGPFTDGSDRLPDVPAAE